MARAGRDEPATPRNSSSTCPRSSRRWPARSGRRTGWRWPTPRPRSAQALGTYVQLDSLDDDIAGTFPASDPVSAEEPTASRRRSARCGACRASAPRQPFAPTEVTLDDGTSTTVDHGSVVIAAITSCTNTSNPSVMIGAALLAKKAVEAGLERKPWVKTTLAPGSKVVMDYYERAGLTPYLEKLGFNLVGYGCTTCIGNSGPLPEAISAAVGENDLAVVSVLSGNRNFEGRINPDVKMNYLASPPLVVAYALAGTMDIDLTSEPIGTGSVRPGRSTWATCGRRRPRSPRSSQNAVAAEMFTRDYADVFAGDERWQALDVPPGDTSPGTRTRPTCGTRRTSTGCRAQPSPVTDIHGARVLALLGDSVTTDHISPAGRDQDRQPGRAVPDRARRGAARLQQLRLPARQPRGDDPRHVRQHPAAQPAGARHRGRRHGQAARGRADLDLRRVARPTSTRARRWWCWAARSTAPARRGTGRPRAPRCSACARCWPSRSSGSTGPT